MLRLLPRPLQHQGHMSSYCTQASAACHSARQRWVVTSEAALHSLAAALSHKLQAGDVYLLYGQVGAGKTTFSRAFIRAVMEDPDYPVTSPTFTLQNIYDEHEGPEIHHFDLYRLQGPQARMDLAHSFAQAVSLVEWPERLPADAVPDPHLAVHLNRMTDEDQEELAASHGLQPQPRAEAADEYEDRAWRLVSLHATSQEWQLRCQLLPGLMKMGNDDSPRPYLLS